MKLQLDLSQDAELRKSIKQLVEQQVKAIAREEFEKTVEEELKRKLEALKVNVSNYELDNQIRRRVDEVLSRLIVSKIEEKLTATELQEHIVARINNRIDSFITNALLEKTIEDVVNRNVQSIINKLSRIKTNE